MKFFDYTYAVFFVHNSDGQWGFGRREIVAEGPIESSDDLKGIENIIVESGKYKDIVLTNVMLLKKRNLVLGVIGVVLKEITEGVKLSFCRSADDALEEFLKEQRR